VLEDMLAVCCSASQSVAVWCALQCVVCCSISCLQRVEGVEMSSASGSHTCLYWDVIAVHFRALQCIALRCIALHCVALRCSAMRYVAVRCGVVCVAVLCVLQHPVYYSARAVSKRHCFMKTSSATGHMYIVFKQRRGQRCYKVSWRFFFWKHDCFRCFFLKTDPVL